MDEQTKKNLVDLFTEILTEDTEKLKQVPWYRFKERSRLRDNIEFSNTQIDKYSK